MDGTWLVGLLAALIATPVAVASYVSAQRSTAAEHLPGRSATTAPDGLTRHPRRRPQRYHDGGRAA